VVTTTPWDKNVSMPAAGGLAKFTHRRRWPSWRELFDENEELQAHIENLEDEVSDLRAGEIGQRLDRRWR